MAAAAEGKEREGKGSGEKIEKENRPPQRSAGYITKQVVYETSNRFLLPLPFSRVLILSNEFDEFQKIYLLKTM